jgi:hypothetical protein
MKNVFYGAIFFGLIGLGVYAGNEAMKMPDVHFSYATGDCVKVVNYDSKFDYTCENYPKKFHHVWVE